MEKFSCCCCCSRVYILCSPYSHILLLYSSTIKNGGKRAIFMCNTVELARQQAEEIRKTTNLKVGLYIGERDVDNWQRKKWETEIEDHQVNSLEYSKQTSFHQQHFSPSFLFIFRFSLVPPKFSLTF